MPAAIHVSTLRISVVAGILTVATGAAAQTSGPVIYQGLTHTALGNAVLLVDSRRNALEISTADPNGGDGVAVHLRSTTTDWQAAVGTVKGDVPLGVSLNAVADGQSISTAALRQVDGRISLSARFTGATAPSYAALVFKDGKLVGSVGGLPPTAHTFIPDWVPCEFLESGCGFIARFRNNHDGACEWSFVLPRTGRITLPDGRQIAGDEVRLIEEVRPAGHYPYLSFDGVTIQTNAPRLTLFSESAR